MLKVKQISVIRRTCVIFVRARLDEEETYPASFHKEFGGGNQKK